MYLRSELTELWAGFLDAIMVTEAAELDDSSKVIAYDICKDFYKTNITVLTAYGPLVSWRELGADLWYSNRNASVGFQDRGINASVEELLATAARTYQLTTGPYMAGGHPVEGRVFLNWFYEVNLNVRLTGSAAKFLNGCGTTLVDSVMQAAAEAFVAREDGL